MKMPSDCISEEICKKGVISFASFMELALYCPETGYYETNKDKIGRQGDFITSISVGRLFGQLLAFQFADWLAALPAAADGGDARLRLVETGAHDGQLARDILDWLQAHRPGLFDQMDYVIIEPSPRRQAWQRETLKPFAARVRWFSQLNHPALGRCRGIIFSNELLDAFPVHRFGWDAAKKAWFEWGVAQADPGGKFCWARMEPPISGIHGLCPADLEAVLPDQFILETSPAAREWWRDAAATLLQGKLLAIDYGHPADDRFSPARTQGTLRAYHRHQHAGNLLADPGRQDLTAHVDFGAIQEVGEAAGLRTETFSTQPQFLTRILRQAVTENIFTRLDAKQVRQFQALTHPEHLGRAFRVLVQAR
jgi:SAM-dependent MidA family methyltransferase